MIYNDKKILGIDFGDIHTGIAISDPTRTLAVPCGTIHAKKKMLLEYTADSIKEKIQGYDIELIVLGYPKNMDGSIGERAKRSEELALLLTAKGFEVLLWDERMTTVSATNILNITNTRGKKRKNIIDTVSASIILQSYLDFLNKKDGEEEDVEEKED